MSAAHLAATLLAIAASTFVAFANFTRRRFVVDQARTLGVRESWIPVLGALNAAAAFGLALGLAGVPLVGTAAAAGLVLYFVAAILVHLRAGDAGIGPPAAFLALAAATLILGLVGSGGAPP